MNTLHLIENSLLYDTWIFIPNWKWMGFFAAFLLGWLLRKMLLGFLASFKDSRLVQSKAHDFIKFFLNQPVERPLSWALTAAFWTAAIHSMAFPAGMQSLLITLVQMLLALNLIQLAYQAVVGVGDMIESFVLKTENTLDDQLAPLITKSLKVLVVILGVLLVLQNFGFNVFSLLAGLGLGGLALALAAQDTAANVFGSITIILDRPFQVGDWVKIGDTEGTVEEIGFRSTRIRTFYQSLVSIPNATVAKEKIDNLGLRPKRRLRHNLGITYETPKEQILKFMDSIRYNLTQRPEVDKESITVAFNSMGDFSLQILINCFVTVSDGDQELRIQQELLFEIMDAAKINGVEFAYPTQLVYQRAVTATQ